MKFFSLINKYYKRYFVILSFSLNTKISCNSLNILFLSGTLKDEEDENSSKADGGFKPKSTQRRKFCYIKLYVK